MSRLSCVLTTLLLTVLTLIGGAATASGAAPALTPRSLAPAVTVVASAPAAPQTHHTGTDHTGHVTGRDFRQRAPHDIRHRAGHDTRSDRGGSDRGRPDHASGAVAEAGTGAVTQAGHEQPRAAADPAQAPRAGTGRPYLLLHAPPPPHDALTPAPPGPAEPRGGVRRTAAESFDAPGSRRGALPGVRGPPGRTTGPTTGPSSCSADPASRPH
ncbi:hypothetical protein [Streptomyces sp. NPDC048142]|uniref:hypothetical protein n=1 Tax=Streptomyces sp. NPDC048142 TaxID=3365501 RepID=UPI00371C0D08